MKSSFFRYLLICCLLSASSMVMAHSKLKSVLPADEATLSAAPAEIVLTFRDTIKLASVTLSNDSGQKINLTFLPEGSSAVYTLATPPLKKGTNTITWRALAADGHLLNGDITYVVE